MLRSSYDAPGYAAKENPAYLPVAVNSLVFFFSDLYRIPLPEKAGVRSVLTEFSSMQKGAADRKSAAPLICFNRRTYLCTRPEALPPIRDLTSSTVTMLKSPSMVCFSAEAAAA